MSDFYNREKKLSYRKLIYVSNKQSYKLFQVQSQRKGSITSERHMGQNKKNKTCGSTVIKWSILDRVTLNKIQTK